eukprot:11145187-Alexandrium_andersonii.AAC.1
MSLGLGTPRFGQRDLSVRKLVAAAAVLLLPALARAAAAPRASAGNNLNSCRPFAGSPFALAE